MARMKYPNFKLKERSIDHLIQGIIVFTSVFLAFWLTEIRNRQNTEQTVKVAFENIASEMTYNHSRVEYVYDYYSGILKQLDSLESADPEKFEKIQGFQLEGWKGVQMPMLRSSAYQTLLNSGLAKDIPIKMLNTLAFIYNLQSLVEKGDHSYIELFIADPNMFSLKKVRHYFQIYAEVLPDVMTSYQALGKPHLEKSGYYSEVQNSRLKILVEQRKSNFKDY